MNHQLPQYESVFQLAPEIFERQLQVAEGCASHQFHGSISEKSLEPINTKTDITVI